MRSWFAGRGRGYNCLKRLVFVHTVPVMICHFGFHRVQINFDDADSVEIPPEAVDMVKLRKHM